MTKFEKGRSGNPRGRPRGIVDRRARFRLMLEEEGEALLRTAIECAKAGDAGLLGKLLDRLLPALKAETSAVAIPGCHASQTAETNAGAVLGALVAGRITLEDAQGMMALIRSRAEIDQQGALLDAIARLLRRSNAELPADLRLRLERLEGASNAPD